MEIELPPTSATDIGTEVTNGLTTYAPLVALFLGIVIAFFVLERIIDTLKNKKNE